MQSLTGSEGKDIFKYFISTVMGLLVCLYKVKKIIAVFYPLFYLLYLQNFLIQFSFLRKWGFFELRKCFDMIAMLWGLLCLEFGERMGLGLFS